MQKGTKIAIAGVTVVVVIIVLVVVYFMTHASGTAAKTSETTPSTTPTPASTTATTPPTITPTTPTSSAWAAFAGYDFAGNDLGAAAKNTTQASCANLCQTTAGCVAALFSPSTGECWSKSALGQNSANPNRVLLLPPSASFQGYDFGGNDIGSALTGMTAQTCAAKCQTTTGCVAALFQPSTGLCWLKNALGQNSKLSDRTLLTSPAAS